MSLPDLKTIHDRCEEEGDCWLWTQRTNSGGHPAASHDGKPMLVRRRAYELSKGYLPDARKRGVVSTCRNKLCCNPDHLVDRGRGFIVRESYKETRNVEHEYAARCAARVQQGGLKCDPALARELRQTAKTETAKDAAARLDCSVSLVQKIRQGRIWRESIANSSVFNMAA